MGKEGIIKIIEKRIDSLQSRLKEQNSSQEFADAGASLLFDQVLSEEGPEYISSVLRLFPDQTPDQAYNIGLHVALDFLTDPELKIVGNEFTEASTEVFCEILRQQFNIFISPEEVRPFLTTFGSKIIERFETR